MDDIYNINRYTDAELYAVLDLSNPTDRELEAKILHMIWKYENFGNNSGDKLARFFNDIYEHFFNTNVEGMTTTSEQPASQPPTSQLPQPQQPLKNPPVGTSISNDILNPVFRQTTTRIVNIDSKFRNKSAITTDYTFNLSTPLKDVVNLKLNSIQIPYTWYTINENYGSNFLYLKGVSKGISDSNYDMQISINPGNYTAEELVKAVNDSFLSLRTNPYFTDISFGITGITYDYPSSKSSIKVDIKKVYNETDYTFDFATWSTPNAIDDTGNNFARGVSIPSFLGYNWKSYTPNIIRSRYDILPLIANSSSDNLISQFTLTPANNYFNIIKYTGTEYITDPSNCTILDDIKITLSLTTGITYSRSQIISDLSDQLSFGNNNKLINSYIRRYDYTDASNNNGFIGYNKSYYEMYIQLNRFNTSRAEGVKIAIVFSNASIWYGSTSVLVFDTNKYELSNIISESKAPQTTIEINSPLDDPSHIYLRCKIPYFNGRNDTGNIIGNTILNDFKIPISNSPEYTFNSYINEINEQIISKNDNGNINITNTLLSLENSFTKLKVDINKHFRENAYFLDTSSDSFLKTILGFTGNPELNLSTDISGSLSISGLYTILRDATIMIIKPKTSSANRHINPYIVTNNTGRDIVTTSTLEVSAQITSLLISFLDEFGDNVLNGSTLDFTRQSNGQTFATLRVIINKYLIEEYYDIEFVDPSANSISSRIVGCGIDTNSNGVLAYSDNNGNNWQGITSTIFSTKANAATYSGNRNMWVAAGAGTGNTLAKSTDGITWTGLGVNTFSTEATGVAWNGYLWVATGDGTGGNTLATSTDGNTWTGLGKTTFTSKATGIAWNGSVWAATGEGGNTIATSSDGNIWTSRATNTLFSTRATGIAWNGYIWVATGYGGNTIAYSKNIMGDTWTASANTRTLFSTGANSVIWNDSVTTWVAVGTGGNTIATSYDGNTWTGQGNTTFTYAGYGVALSGNQFIAIGEGGNSIVRSTNGTSWTIPNPPTFTKLYGIGWDNKTIGIIIGCGIDTSNNGVLAYSDNNGNNWYGATSTIFSTKANAATYNQSIWIAVGKGTDNTLAKSTDGATWTGLGINTFSTEATGVAWNGQLWVATGKGTGNTLATSVDGTNWTGLGKITFATKATGIAWNGSTWAATGNGGNTIATSEDGNIWTSRATTTLFSAGATGIAWNGSIWVATGNGGNTIAYSSDILGDTWTASATTSLFSNGANGVVWNESVQLWVAVGTGGNTIATSDDGNIWTGQGNTTFTDAGYSVSLSGNQYIAVGEGGNIIVRSTNGISWTVPNSSPFEPGYGIGWDNKTIGINPTMINDQSNSWIRNLKLSQSKFALSDYRTVNLDTWSQISGISLVSVDVITLTNNLSMNKIYLTPITVGLKTGTNDYSNGIVLTIPVGIYTRDQLITAINNEFTNRQTGVSNQTIASGSIAKVIKVANGDEYIQIRLNINKIYTSYDYKVVFYDPFGFSTILNCNAKNIGSTSWDSTLGWILGFREETEYDLSKIARNGNIVNIIGDNVVSISIYSYFMILMDDYNNSHMNDGIVTTTKKETDVKLPLYANRASCNTNPISGNLITTNISSDGAPLTQKQVYAIQATLDQQTTQLSALKFTEGPFATNLFGIIPLNIANLPNNSIYVDNSIGLRDQQRNYFGPVNIQRMSVKLINDRGETVDLNGANWSFSFICEQLYQNNRA